MASNILKNNSFGGPTYFDRRWAICLGSLDKRAELGWPSSRGKGWPTAVKEAQVYVVLRYYYNANNKKGPFFWKKKTLASYLMYTQNQDQRMGLIQNQDQFIKQVTCLQKLKHFKDPIPLSTNKELVL